MAVFPCADVEVLVRATSSAAWADFTAGKEPASRDSLEKLCHNQLLGVPEHFMYKSHHKIKVSLGYLKECLTDSCGFETISIVARQLWGIEWGNPPSGRSSKIAGWKALYLLSKMMEGLVKSACS